MNPIVADTVTQLLSLARLDDAFRADFAKAVQADYDAGHAANATVYESVPLTDAEIAALRAKLKA